jgi:ADP-heptose:LPS heptosyltransferase
MVLTLPMVGAIRYVRPEVELLLFAHPRTEALVKGQPAITTAVFVEHSTALRYALQQWQPDILFFPRPVVEEVWAAWLAGVPYRIGSGYRWYSLLFTHRIYEHRKTAERHEAEYNVRMVEKAAGVAGLPVKLLRPVVEETARQRVAAFLEHAGLWAGGFVVLHPGGRGSAPRWAPESFAVLAQRLEEEGIPCVLTGTAAELPLAERIRESYPKVCCAVGRFTTEEFIALLAQSRVVVANSTGALHIAAALGIPVVGLYSRLPVHHPRRWGPYTPAARVLVPPPEAPPDAVAAIPWEHVYQAVRELWEEPERTRNSSVCL